MSSDLYTPAVACIYTYMSEYICIHELNSKKKKKKKKNHRTRKKGRMRERRKRKKPSLMTS